jgi:transmembrane protein 132
VEFSDGSSTSVSDINMADYAISVDSLSPEVVAFAPMLTSIHPRVIAVGEGKGNLLKVSLLLPDTCRAEARLKDFVLVSTSAFINVIFYDNEYGQKSPMLVQNDGGIVGAVGGILSSGSRGDKRNEKEQLADLQEFISGISPSNEVIKETAVQARQHQSSKNNYLTIHRRSTSHISPMEMGMYIILATFSFAIIVFVVSCIVYASKYKPQGLMYQDDCADTAHLSNGYKLLSNSSGPTKREPPTTNVHDWVWLGRATLERASGLLVPSISVNEKHRRKNDNWIRITSNPTYTPEPSPDVVLIEVDRNDGDTTQPNVNPISGNANRPHIDSTTYNKHNPKELPRRTSRQR